MMVGWPFEKCMTSSCNAMLTVHYKPALG